MTELLTLKFMLTGFPLALILLLQIVFLTYVFICKRKINSLPYESEAEEEIKDKLFEVQQKFTIAVLSLCVLSISILLTV
jgi:di/tricarboxylate transporter